MGTLDPKAAWLVQVAQASASVANYCDHIEHNEFVDRDWITAAARTLRRVAMEIAADEKIDLLGHYAARLSQIERLNVLWTIGDCDGGRLVQDSTTWRSLQLAQVEHDRRFHPDVMGLSKMDQLRHYSFHLAKLTGAVAELVADVGDQEAFWRRRLPDLVLFGIKLSTVVGERLSDDPLPRPPLGGSPIFG